eukprot:gene10675-19402_t
MRAAEGIQIRESNGLHALQFDRKMRGVMAENPWLVGGNTEAS